MTQPRRVGVDVCVAQHGARRRRVASGRLQRGERPQREDDPKHDDDADKLLWG